MRIFASSNQITHHIMTNKPNIGDADFMVKRRGYDLTLTALATQYEAILNGTQTTVTFPSTKESDARATATVLVHRPIARIYCGLPVAGARCSFHHRYIKDLYYENQQWHCELGDIATQRVEIAHVTPRVIVDNR